MCGAGWTSYWVTTGPALRPTISAWMSKLGQLLPDDLLVVRVDRLFAAGRSSGSRGGRRAIAGRRQDGTRRSRVGAESPASVTSSRRGRSPGAAGGRRAAAATPAARGRGEGGRGRRRRWGWRPGCCAPDRRPRPRCRSGLGRAGRRRRPHRAALGGRRRRRATRRPGTRRSRRRPSSPLRASPPSTLPSQRAPPVSGPRQLGADAGRTRSGAPTTIRTTSRTNAPGAVSSGTRSSSRNRRSARRRAPRRGRSTLRTSRQPRTPTIGDRETEQRAAPAGARLPAGPPLEVPAGAEQHERQQPAAGLEPRRDRVAPPVGEARPRPAAASAISVTAPSTSSTMPTIERTTSGADRRQPHGGQPAAAASPSRGRLAAGRRCAVGSPR